MRDAQPDPKNDSAVQAATEATGTPNARAVSGVHWGFPVGAQQQQQPPVDPADPPAKSAFHQSCDPVLTDNPAFDHEEASDAPVLTNNPTYEGSSDGGEETGFVDCEDSASVDGREASQTGPNSSHGAREEGFVEPKFLRPGHDDDDNLLVSSSPSPAGMVAVVLYCMHATRSARTIGLALMCCWRYCRAEPSLHRRVHSSSLLRIWLLV